MLQMRGIIATKSATKNSVAEPHHLLVALGKIFSMRFQLRHFYESKAEKVFIMG
jgi:hypothetical protein